MMSPSLSPTASESRLLHLELKPELQHGLPRLTQQTKLPAPRKRQLQGRQGARSSSLTSCSSWALSSMPLASGATSKLASKTGTFPIH